MKRITILILICLIFLFANINTFEIKDKKINKESFKKMIEHIEKIKRLLRNLEEEDDDELESSGDDNNSVSEEPSSEAVEESKSNLRSDESESSPKSCSPSESSPESDPPFESCL